MKHTFRNLFLSAGIILATAFTGHAQILYVANQSTNKIETYNATTGALLNNSFITGLSNPWGVTGDASTNMLYIAQNSGPNSVLAYDLSGGTPSLKFSINLSSALDVQVSGSTLYVSNYNTNKIGKYNAATGAVINASYFTIPLTAQGITLTNGEIFTANNGGNVSAYNASTGATVTDPLVTGLVNPEMIASSGSVLYVTDHTAGGRIGSYDPSTGAAIKPSLVSLSNAFGVTYFNNAIYADTQGGRIAAYDLSGNPLAGFTTISNPGNSYGGLVVIPEPGTVGLVGMGGLTVAFAFLKRRKAA